jgi:hypothetical protein
VAEAKGSDDWGLFVTIITEVEICHKNNYAVLVDGDACIATRSPAKSPGWVSGGNVLPTDGASPAPISKASATNKTRLFLA